jgi:hypothetical protein
MPFGFKFMVTSYYFGANLKDYFNLFEVLVVDNLFAKL